MYFVAEAEFSDQFAVANVVSVHGQERLGSVVIGTSNTQMVTSMRNISGLLIRSRHSQILFGHVDFG